MLQQQLAQKQLENLLADWKFFPDPKQADMLCFEQAIGDALEHYNECVDRVLATPVEQDEQVAFMEATAKFGANARRTLSGIKANVKMMEKSQSIPVLSNESHRVAAKLPTITLPEFSGHYDDWLAFSDQFHTAIDSNLKLSSAQKLVYLKRCMKGSAE